MLFGPLNMSLLLTIGLIHIIALVSPGPDFALILRCRQSRLAAFGAALGISLAIGIHTLLSLAGISLIIQNTPTLYTLVQFFGASYLAWLSWGAFSSFFRKSEVREKRLVSFSSFKKGLYVGVLTNLSNPKALLFFIGLLSGLVTPEVNFLIRTLLVGELFLLSFFWFSFLAWFVSKVQGTLNRFDRPISLVTGILFAFVSLSIFRTFLFHW